MGSMCIGVGGMGKGSMTACAESRGCGIIGKGAFFFFFFNFTCIPGHVTKTKTGCYMGIGNSVRTPGAAPPKPAFVVLPHWYIT